LFSCRLRDFERIRVAFLTIAKQCDGVHIGFRKYYLWKPKGNQHVPLIFIEQNVDVMM